MNRKNIDSSSKEQSTEFLAVLRQETRHLHSLSHSFREEAGDAVQMLQTFFAVSGKL